MNRRGSALLIVLGLLSFLTVSAIAFSAYMRTQRLPTSYLVRTTSSRELAKAALVEAIETLENAIGDDPHPGVGTSVRNRWRNRVFVDTGGLVDVDKTVSTLTLEGLAYVPAPLVNDMRYYSRRTLSAMWHQLRFDCGRWAFSALDVSDYFDVHRLKANLRRSSAADSRVSGNYLFGDDASAWDSFMQTYRDGAMPLVSNADLNLALWSAGGAALRRRAPWCAVVAGGETDYVKDSDDDRAALSNMVFVTDSWYPPARDRVAKPFNLASQGGQPFLPSLNLSDESAGASRGFEQVMMGVSTASATDNDGKKVLWSNLLGLEEFLQLADYLDFDSRPSCLCLPTTERVPMLTGVSLKNEFSKLELSLVASAPRKVGGGAGAKKTTYEVTCYTLKLQGELHALVSAVWPFAHRRTGESPDYKVQVAATLTFVPQADSRAVRYPDAAAPVQLTWMPTGTKPTALAYPGAKGKSVVAFCSKPKDLKVKLDPQNAKDCLIGPVDVTLENFSVDLTSTIPKGDYDDKEETCTFRRIQKVETDPNTGAETRSDVEFANGFMPSKDDLAAAFEKDTDVLGRDFMPVVQLGVRIVDADGSPVDLMPAGLADDPLSANSKLLKTMLSKGAQERPFLVFFNKGSSVSASQKWCEDNANKKLPLVDGLSPAAYLADDPRFNHAPEDLLALEAKTGMNQAEIWLANCTAPALSGGDAGEKDIFMATSDAGYLQSKYELANLLDVSGFFPDATTKLGDLTALAYNGTIRKSSDQIAARELMWRTYAPWTTNGRDDGFDDLPIESGSDGQRICPYSPDPAVMMGAFVDTPFDWWAASTNDEWQGVSPEEARKYAYSEEAAVDTLAHVEWDEWEAFAARFARTLRSRADGDWVSAYDDLWNGGAGAADTICGHTFRDARFREVDRKFLYGFWRECFDSRQQLFLLFVRAEPLMMGGDTGKMPPMMGGRAVALVWRDPARPVPTSQKQQQSGNKKNDQPPPHQTRVLFYRPLE